MKKTIFVLSLLTILIGCGDESTDPVVQTGIQSPENPGARTATNGRTPEGSGSGAPTSPNGSGGGTSGYALTWNGDGRWHGNFVGTSVWFWGPTPTQLKNGIQGTWEVTCAYYTPGVCYPDGFVVWGNGAGFTVGAPACSGLSTTTITMPLLTATLGVDFKSGNSIVLSRVWGTDTRTVTSLSGGNCSLFAQGKVIVNENCQPMIVSPESTYANLCGMAYAVE
jgi:hypothetical protein